MNDTYFLYADENLEDRDCLKNLLFQFIPPIKLIPVNNGFELIEFLQEVQEGKTYPSLIILNEKMGRLDGLTTLELLKSDDIYCLIPVIVLCPEVALKAPSFYRHLGADVITKRAGMAGWKKLSNELCAYSF